MPEWITGKEVESKDIKKSLKAITEEVCFKCPEHSDKCSIAKAAADIKVMEE
jgi:hypothetical protein